ncbi:hypothetical protein J2W32_005016 [Variovorax boronicumulans]|uniref:Uncharacterized protein n=1 Tax=Variovorax boronicumulans TaxID=436515 RepID=A0AAW8D7X8_9BURK|nr:hypothetical protein [Variovorax boronicumulans]MDP9895916.1 hypothetical protein [Variovorax boronicumulans]MDQ0038838.1 hypothetical protein [Variovorax boronicumulans]MDQ0055956.1 hypothetical protein [Variovorax boronicumulans]
MNAEQRRLLEETLAEDERACASNWNGFDVKLPRLRPPQQPEHNGQGALAPAARLKCRLINRHRRIEFEELMRYKDEQKQRSAGALKRLNYLSQEMGEEL